MQAYGNPGIKFKDLPNSGTKTARLRLRNADRSAKKSARQQSKRFTVNNLKNDLP